MNHRHHLIRFAAFCQPDDRIQRIVQKMGVDLRLQDFKLTLALRFLLIDNLVHQLPDPLQHHVETPRQLLHLISAADIDRRIEVPLPYLLDGTLQLANGTGNQPGEENG
ncbi:hypothetical protein D3C75_714390 [compost metagenome]